MRYNGKMKYVVWNKVYHMMLDGTELHDNDCNFKKFAGNTPEEALEKWIEEVFDGTECLNSIRLKAAISGIPWESEENELS